MNIVLRPRIIKTSLLSVGLLALTGLVAFGVLQVAPAPNAAAGGAWGNSGTGTGSSSGSYYTSHGFGWKLFDVNSSGPNGGFKTGSWSNASSQCKSLGDNRVWVHVVRDPSGNEKSFTYEGASYNRNRPSAGLDPYVFNSSGVYSPQGQAYQQKVINIVTSVYYKYLEANPSGSGWGVNIGWFCWSDNPPWDITVTSKTDKPSGVIEIGETVTWTHAVTNTGPNKTNVPIKWHYETTGDLTDPDGSEQTIASGKPSSGGYPATIGTQTSSYTAGPGDYGKRLCERALANPKANDDSGTYTSTESCVIVSKKPKVQVMGGDLSVGRSLTGATVKSMILTSTSSWSGNIYGSWGEYGLLATGIIEGTASGAAYKGGLVTTGSSTCSYNLLSFANATNSGTTKACSASGQKIGNFTNTGNIPDIASQFKNATANYVDFNDRTKNRIESANTDITIPGGTLEKGNWLVINASGHTVTINGDINYTTDTLTALSDIPQLVIIADRININGGVTNVDAWLIARGTNGTINTCTEKAPTDALSDADCSNKLTVNGAVMAKSLYLLRTFGNKTGDVEEPAETFNLRADASLWSAARALEGIRINIAASNELPPRF